MSVLVIKGTLRLFIFPALLTRPIVVEMPSETAKPAI